jgi:GNAT superfamily N-acetyltransferase
MDLKLEVMLVLNDLNEAPKFELPQGYAFKFHDTFGKSNWLKIQNKSYLNEQPFGEELYLSQFNNKMEALSERQIFVFDKAHNAIGTGTAWFDHLLHEANCGRIHWVAVLPGHQNQGIGLAICTKLLEICQEMGHEKVIITTEGFRSKAINIYEKFGFVGYPRNENEANFWLQKNQ